jgi:hypothetical protein
LFAGGKVGCYSVENPNKMFHFAARGDFHGMKILTRVAFLVSLLLLPALLQAQDGCVTSPECPTAILGLVGAAAAALYARWRSR